MRELEKLRAEAKHLKHQVNGYKGYLKASKIKNNSQNEKA